MLTAAAPAARVQMLSGRPSGIPPNSLYTVLAHESTCGCKHSKRSQIMRVKVAETAPNLLNNLDLCVVLARG